MNIRRSIICIVALLPIVVSCKPLLNLAADPYIYLCEYRGGYWGEWERSYTCAVTGNVGSLNSTKDLDSDEWDSFSGLFEFYSTQTTTSKAVQNVVHLWNSSYMRPHGSIHYSRPATIKAQRGFGRVTYNVFFDGVGIGIILPVSF